MAPLNRLERLQRALLRLRQIQHEAAAIYRDFPELDGRPKIGRGRRLRTTASPDKREATGTLKLH